MIERALAKVNLSLQIKGRLPDGYHALESLVAFADLGETVRMEVDGTAEVTTSGPFAAAIEGENLVARAIAAARCAVPGLQAGAVHIDKHIPVAAGLGGGSADAAAALRLLRRLAPAPPVPPDWHALAAGLGADVPVCLASRAGLIWNVGDRFLPAPQPLRLWAVLANANAPVPADKTRRVFSSLGARPITTPGPPASPPWDDLLPWLQAASNDLEPAARELLPGAAEVERALRALPGSQLVRMSGAGPTWYALFQSQSSARQAREGLATSFPGWWTCAVCLN